MLGKHFINNDWIRGTGEVLTAHNPASQEVIWQDLSAAGKNITAATKAAANAFPEWSRLSVEQRLNFLERFVAILSQNRKNLSETLSINTGKPLWEAETEINAVINKLPISVKAYDERCRTRATEKGGIHSVVRHKPHGVLAVLGPFNFPVHLPHGHILPALLAGNTIIFKPSEFTPLIAEAFMQCWEKADLPPGVINLVQGGPKTASLLTQHEAVKGVLFTGSYRTGQLLLAQLSKTPERLLALEMGGNNPLVVHQVSLENHNAALYQIIQSAYLTAGQRCTCARRLIVVDNKHNRILVEKLIEIIPKIKVGSYLEQPEPFMGPLISLAAAKRVEEDYHQLVSEGATILAPLQVQGPYDNFLSPALLEVTALRNRSDEEIFGPVLQLIWVNHFEEAIREANNTRYGLAAGILTDSENEYQRFFNLVEAGVINWNRPLTGASSEAPFGGVKRSGNFRPSAYYAADYCAYPVATLEETTLSLPEQKTKGLPL